jgi:hypothetical protein
MSSSHEWLRKRREIKQNGKPPFMMPNAPRRLQVPVHLYTGRMENYQHAHPDLLNLPNRFKNGFEYVMVATPYAGGDARYENVSVMFSNDLENWDNGGVSNPIVSPPEDARASNGPHNCDNCLVFDSASGEFYIYYILFRTDKKHTLCRLASDDCIHWGPTEALVDLDVFSPSIIYEANEKSFYMWAGKSCQMHLYRSQDGRKWEFVAECNVHQSYLGKIYQVWHLTVLRVRKEYWAFNVMNPAGELNGQAPTHIFFFRSNDKVNWLGYNSPVLSPSPDGWDSGAVYRLGALVKNRKLFVVYSGYKSERHFFLRKRSTWGLGYSEIDISALVNQESKSNNVIA